MDQFNEHTLGWGIEKRVIKEFVNVISHHFATVQYIKYCISVKKKTGHIHFVSILLPKPLSEFKDSTGFLFRGQPHSSIV